MTDERKMEIGLAINKIATILPQDYLDKVKPSLQTIEDGFGELIDELEGTSSCQKC